MHTDEMLSCRLHEEYSRWDLPLRVKQSTLLYHYTNVNGAQGIMRDGAFRIRQLTKLSDQQECGFGLEMINDILSSINPQSKAVLCLRTVLQSYLTTWGFCRDSRGGIGVQDTGVSNAERTYKSSIFELSLTLNGNSKRHKEEYCGGKSGFIFEMTAKQLSSSVINQALGTQKHFKATDRPLEIADAISPPYVIMYTKDDVRSTLDSITERMDKTIRLIEKETCYRLEKKGRGYQEFEVYWVNQESPNERWQGSEEFNYRIEVLLLHLMCLIKQEGFSWEEEVRVIVMLPKTEYIKTVDAKDGKSAFDCVFLSVPGISERRFGWKCCLKRRVKPSAGG